MQTMVYAARDPDTMRQLLSACLNDDQATLDDLWEQDAFIDVEPRTPVRPIHHAFSHLHVEILDGEHAGSLVWLGSPFIVRAGADWRIACAEDFPSGR